MSTNQIREIKPGNQPLKLAMVKSLLFVLGRATPAIARMDVDVQKEIKQWDEGFKVMFEILPDGPYLSLEKRDDELHFLGLVKTDADLVVTFKNLESAFLLLTTQISTPQAYAQHRIGVKGEIVTGMSFTRCLNVVQFLLFPGFIARRILKRMPDMTLRRWFIRLYAYLVAVPLGV